jgi:Caspase domain/Domain of unknown function (DUF4384)
VGDPSYKNILRSGKNMSLINRRRFLQVAGASLTALGVNQWEIEQQSIHYARALAQNSTPRKLALLVGINRNDDSRWPVLLGAENDIRLQKELLIHRFGFRESDVLTLEGTKATRANILQTFESHLVQQAKPGDVVVFHFSGHGSQVADPDQVLGKRVSTLVPIDSDLPAGYPKSGGAVNDITGHTLWLLMRSLDTENVTFVLDCCHSGGARKGIVTVRSRPGDAEILSPNLQLLASLEEQEYQRKLMGKLGLSRSDFAAQRKKGIPKGLFLAAARRDQFAIDTTFADIDVGIFTYVLTRYLWQETSRESTSQVMVKTAQSTQYLLQRYFPNDDLVQQPELNTLEGSTAGQQSVYFTPRSPGPAADAVITGVKGDQVDLFLGGIDPQSLEAFGRGAIFTLLDSEGREQGKVQVESRQKLTARGKLVQAMAQGTISPGSLLQEHTRAIPTNLTLRIGLDASLGSEQEQARLELQKIRRVEAIPVTNKEVHYILGRVTRLTQQTFKLRAQGTLPPVDSFVLFSPGMELIPGPFGVEGETVSVAVKRLELKLKSLLAARLVKITLNPTSSRLNVAAAMEVIDGRSIVADAFTVRGGAVQSISQARGTRAPSSSVNQLQPGTLVQFLIRNNEQRPIYISVLLISVDGTLAVLSPLPGGDTAAPIEPGQEIKVPDPERNRGEQYQFKIGKDLGMAEALVIASFSPLKRSIELLRTLAEEPGHTRGNPIELNQEPDESIVALMQDLGEGTRSPSVDSLQDIQRLSTQAMAALSITFKVDNKS